MSCLTSWYCFNYGGPNVKDILIIMVTGLATSCMIDNDLSSACHHTETSWLDVPLPFHFKEIYPSREPIAFEPKYDHQSTVVATFLAMQRLGAWASTCSRILFTKLWNHWISVKNSGLSWDFADLNHCRPYLGHGLSDSLLASPVWTVWGWITR